MKSAPLLSILLFLPLLAHAQFDESGFRQALKVKKNLYLGEGGITGGDRMSSNFKVTSVRVAANPGGFDRLVVDFPELKRPPFFLVESDPALKRVAVTVYGKPKLDFSSQSAIQSAKKTRTISKIDFIPLVDEDRWTFTAETQKPVKTEVFELSEPARIIIDLKP